MSSRSPGLLQTVAINPTKGMLLYFSENDFNHMRRSHVEERWEI